MNMISAKTAYCMPSLQSVDKPPSAASRRYDSADRTSALLPPKPDRTSGNRGATATKASRSNASE
ncbi:MAG: hypothetical protein ACI4KA_02530 [Oscillospiraceae bacterium]